MACRSVGRLASRPLSIGGLVLCVSLGRNSVDPEGAVPVLTTPLASCSCDATVTLSQTHGGTLPTCVEGTASTPCFNGAQTKVGGDDDVPGRCHITVPEGESPCPDSATSCMYVSRKVIVSAAACADMAHACGTGPWQLHSTAGQAVGPKIQVGGGEVETTVSIGNESCDTESPGTYYDLAIKDSGDVVITTMRLTVKCKNCTGS